MKNLYITILIFLFYSAISQTNVVVIYNGSAINNGDTAVFNASDDPSLEINIGSIELHNAGSINYEHYSCKKDEYDLVSGSEVALCWAGHCSPPWYDVMPYTDTFNSGDNYFDFHGDFKSYGHVGISYVNIIFYDGDNPSDSVYFTAKFNITASTIINKIEDNICNIFPNPALDILSVNLNSKITEINIYDIIGDKVLEQNNINKLNTNIDISTLTTGQYFIQIKTDNKKIFYQKFIKR